MTKRTKIIIASVALVALGLHLMNLKKRLNSTDASAIEENNTLDLNKVLSKGTVSEEVGILQKALGQLKVDNIFGKLTEARLKAVTGKTSITLNEYNTIVKK